MKCIDGCKYFKGIDSDRHTICSLSGTMARNIIPYIGCYRGEKESHHCQKDNAKQGGIFDVQDV